MRRALDPLLVLVLLGWALVAYLRPDVAREFIAIVGGRVAWAQPPPEYYSSGAGPGVMAGGMPTGTAVPYGNSSGPYGPGLYSPVISSPSAPVVTTRPAGWPGAAPEPDPRVANVPTPYPGTGSAAHGASPPTALAPPPSPLVTGDFNGAEIVARVGTEVILASDVLFLVNERLLQFQDEIAKTSPEDLKQFKLKMMRQFLPRLIDTKLAAQEARRTLPVDNYTKFEQKVHEHFDKEVIKQMMEALKVSSRGELEVKLRQLGGSLESRRADFVEEYLAGSWLHQQVKEDAEITHEDILAYYRAHQKDYEMPAKARWEHLMVKTDKYPSRDEARAAIIRWGNEIWQGKPFADIARAHSDDFSANDGGVHDWTTQGSLVSQVLDQAIFGLEVGRMSQILEDNNGFHIVRVTERKDLFYTPFTEAQAKIKKQIKNDRLKREQDDAVAKLRKQMSVWTIFDEPAKQDPSAQSASAQRY